MIENGLWAIIKEYLLVPVAMLFFYLFRRHVDKADKREEKLLHKVELLDQRQDYLERDNALINERIENIRKDVSEIKDGVKELLKHNGKTN